MSVRIALVGCGAITEAHHLPLAVQAGEVTLLVDTNEARTKMLAARHGVPNVSKDLNDVFAHADAAIVAVPNHLHAPIASTLLERGVHVLLEKPMGLNGADCDLIQAAEAKGGAVLAMGHPRRFWATTAWVKTAMERSLIGELVSFEVRDGWQFAWPLASTYLFERQRAGGGCLMDMGPHLVDLLLYWLGDLEVLAYRDDAEGGVEANCEVEVRTKKGATGFVEFSRTRQLRNTFLLKGTKGLIEMGAEKGNQLAFTMDGETQVVGMGLRPTDRHGDRLNGPERDRVTWRLNGKPLWVEDFDALMKKQLDDFLGAVRGEHPPWVPSSEGRRSVDFVEVCYGMREPLEPPHLRRVREVNGARG
ncbi:MAG: Gfo/Idh/MocA family oxidoreductase [Deltaproteobacteria bacterium]